MATMVMLKKETLVIDVFGRIKNSRWRTKCENSIKQARSQLYTQKIRREAIITQSRADIAQLLMSGHYDDAMARVGQLHDNECLLSAYGQIGRFCHTVLANIREISSRRGLTYEAVEAVSSLVYAASRCGELPETHQLRILFKKHFGAEFERKNVRLQPGNLVNTQIKYNLGSKSLSDDEKVEITCELARQCNISLKPDQLRVKQTVPQNESFDTDRKDQREASKIKDTSSSKTWTKFSLFDPGSLFKCYGKNDLSQGRDAMSKTDGVYGKLDGSRRENKKNDLTILMKLGLSRPETQSRRRLLQNEDSDSFQVKQCTPKASRL